MIVTMDKRNNKVCMTTLKVTQTCTINKIDCALVLNRLKTKLHNFMVFYRQDWYFSAVGLVTSSSHSR